MNDRRVRAIAASTLLAAGTCATGIPSAVADPLPTAHASVGVTYPTTTTFHVCAGGIADSTGEWVFEVDGTRGDGTQIHYQQTGFGPTFDTCISPDVSTNGIEDGCFTATLFFGHIPPIDTTGVQTSATPELVAVASEETEWTPQQNSAGFGT